jgi:hypothetical protein
MRIALNVTWLKISSAGFGFRVAVAPWLAADWFAAMP